MRRVLVAMGVLGVILAVVLWIERGRESDTPATPATPQSGSSATPPATKPAAATSAQLTVTVRDAKGPLAGARVRIEPAHGDVSVLETRPDGTGQLALAPGAYTVAASAKDHEPRAAAPLVLGAGQTERIELVLADGGHAVTGTVTDVNGGPIAGARIDAARLEGKGRPDAAIATTLTDADGNYALSVAEGQLLVAARSPDYAAQARYVEVGAAGATVDFALVPGGVIEGVVLDDRSKQPAAGAVVSARRDSGSLLLAEGGARSVTAGPDGRFRIAGLRPGAYELGAHVDARRTRTPTQVGLGVAEQITDLQLLVGRAPTVRGLVLDDDGKPVAGARVATLANLGAEDVTSDAKGAFALEGLPAGNHALLALVDTHVPVGPTNVTVADKDVEGVMLRVRKAGKLVGHVEPRQPACEIGVEADDERPMMLPMEMLARGDHATDPNGNFTVAPVTPGKLTLTARCAKGNRGKVSVAWTPSTTDVVIVVAPGASIAGKLIDGDDLPIAGATVAANTQTGTVRTTIVNGMVTSGIQAITTAAGTYVLEGLEPGTYRMTALERGRPLRPKQEPPVVTIAAAEHKTGVTLQVDRPTGVIRGVVTGPDGKPLADAWVSVQQDLDALVRGASGERGGPEGERGESRTVTVTDDGDDDARAGSFPPVLTDAQGRFELSGLPHLAFDVVAEAQAGKLRGRAEGVTPDANLTIKALGVTSLSGTVRGPKGPAGLFTVTLEGPTRTQRSFTDGTFSLGRVDPGSYVVRVQSTDGNGQVSTVVAPNTPTTVDVALVANAVVVGTVVGPTGQPMPDVPVVAIDDTGDGRVQVSIDGPPPTSGPDGRFRIERKAGKVIVVALGGRPPPVMKKVTLEEGKTLDIGALQLPAPPKP